MAVGFGNWPSWLREWSQSLGVGLAMVTLASSLIAVPLSAAGQLSLADGQVTAWVMTIYTVPCVLGIVLTLHFRQPLLLTGNIFVLIFIVSLQGRVPFAELAGASLVAGAAVVAISALGLTDHLARLIPEPVVVGLLAGSTLPFVAGVFTGMGSEPAVVGAAFLAYILGRKYLESRVPPIFLALAVGIGAAAVLGKDAEARELRDLSENVRRAWQHEYLLADGTVRGGTQANCVRALAFDLVPDAARTAVTEQLASLVREAGTHLGTGFLATPYLLPALADNGQLDLAYDLLMQDSAPSWLVMVDRGATTIWEDWNGLGPDGSAQGSLNHYSKGAVISFLHRYTAGLRQAPGSAGWERVIIEPRPGAGLTSASTSHHGPQGLIEVGWTIHDGVLTLTATVPAGTTADVRLPGEPAAAVGPGTHEFSADAGPCAPARSAETSPDLARSTP